MANAKNEQPKNARVRVRAREGAGGATASTTQKGDIVTVEQGLKHMSDEEIAKLLTQSGGFVSRVAKTIGCAPSTLQRRIEKSERLKETLADVSDTVLDIAESSLIKAAGNGEPWAVCFILKCKGKKRGWIEKHDISVEHKDAMPPVVLGVIPIDNSEKGK